MKLIEILNDILIPQRIKNEGFSVLGNVENVMYIKLDDNRRVEATICKDKFFNCYSTIRVTLTHKLNGIINTQIINFDNIFKYENCIARNKVIYYDDGKYSWDEHPTEDDIETLRTTVINYLHMWE